jgi:hopanoid biosynthesis associated protein HpnK
VGRLIINADDFGLTQGVNRAIAELNHEGVLTSATIMAKALATAEAVEIARATPSLGVGCHVVLVDGEPLLSPGEIPKLARPNGRFAPSLSEFLRRLAVDRIFTGGLAQEIEAESRAQIGRLQSMGVRLTHVDSHKHTHMFPSVLRPLLRAARAAGIRAVRNPFEPVWSIQATTGAPWIRRAEVTMLRRLEPAFRRIVAEEGFVTTSGSIGVLATGTLSAAAVASLLAKLPAGVWELVSHPGYNDADLAHAHTRLTSSRDLERSALHAVKQFPALELQSFAELSCDPHER